MFFRCCSSETERVMLNQSLNRKEKKKLNKNNAANGNSGKSFVCFKFLHKQTWEKEKCFEFERKNLIFLLGRFGFFQTQIFPYNSSNKYVKRNPKIDINFRARCRVFLTRFSICEYRRWTCNAFLIYFMCLFLWCNKIMCNVFALPEEKLVCVDKVDLNCHISAFDGGKINTYKMVFLGI